MWGLGSWVSVGTPGRELSRVSLQFPFGLWGPLPPTSPLTSLTDHVETQHTSAPASAPQFSLKTPTWWPILISSLPPPFNAYSPASPSSWLSQPGSPGAMMFPYVSLSPIHLACEYSDQIKWKLLFIELWDPVSASPGPSGPPPNPGCGDTCCESAIPHVLV